MAESERSLKSLWDDALFRIERAQRFEKARNFHEARAEYFEAAVALRDIRQRERKQRPNPLQKSKGELIAEKQLGIYIGKAEEMQRLEASSPPPEMLETDPRKEEADILLGKAVEQDKQGFSFDAIPTYTKCAELYLQIVKTTKDDELKETCRKQVESIVARVESLKGIKAKPKSKSGGSRENVGVAGESLSKEEIAVLRKASYLCGRKFDPWIPSDAYQTRFKYIDKFEDSDGKLPLSEKQRQSFGGWRRISSLSSKPTITALVSAYSLKQTLITDCSFVSSLAVTANYERQFKKKLITSIIYPQNRHQIPVYNPSGKYVVKLHLNGVPRKVVVDDFLPTRRGDGKLLCSFSNNKNEFWVSILEKAFLKVMGGYDFPGSISTEDLYVLTGWIPERIEFKENMSPGEKTKLFHRIVKGMEFGDCLATTGTRNLPEQHCERLGLVPSHAYAILQTKEVKEGSRLYRFLQLKNPWSHTSWKGKFSDHDTQNWTPHLRRVMNFDQMSAMMIDNGIFWIELDDLLQYFGKVGLNWNPGLFKYRISQHYAWPRSQGPKNDQLNMGENPQYLVDIDAREDDCQVWILLTKHMESTKRQDQSKEDFLALQVYTGVRKYDRLIHRRRDGELVEKTVYRDSPHSLVRLDCTKGSVYTYTLVVSQWEKKHDISFTIELFCTIPKCRFKPWKSDLQFTETMSGAWIAGLDGGCGNFQRYNENPQFQFKIDVKTRVRLELLAPKDFSVNMQIFSEPLTSSNWYRPDIKLKDTGDYMAGVCVLDVTTENPFILVPSTFRQGKHGAFRLAVTSSTKLAIGRIK